jgi:hypothetical protein
MSNKAAAENQIRREAQPLDQTQLFDFFSQYLTPSSQISTYGSGYADMALCDPRDHLISSIRDQNEPNVYSSYSENMEHSSLPRTERPGNIQPGRFQCSGQSINKHNAKFVKRELHRTKSQIVYGSRPTSNNDLLYNYCLEDIKIFDTDPTDQEISDAFTTTLQEIQMKIKRSSVEVKRNLTPATNQESKYKKKIFSSDQGDLLDLIKYSQLATPISYLVNKMGSISRVEAQRISSSPGVNSSMKAFVSDASANYSFARQIANGKELFYSDDSHSVFTYSLYWIKKRLRGNKFWINNRGIDVDKFFSEWIYNLDLTQKGVLNDIAKSCNRLAKKIQIDGKVFFSYFLIIYFFPNLPLASSGFANKTLLNLLKELKLEELDSYSLALYQYFKSNLDDYGSTLSLKLSEIFYHFGFFYLKRSHIFRLFVYADYIINQYT